MYERVGTYAGKKSLGEIADQAKTFDVAWAADGHGTTTEHLTMVRDAFAADLAETIPGVWARSMLVMLAPGGNIPVHRDLPLAAESVRYHLVLTTNPRCWNYHDGGFQQLEEGGVYTVDMTAEHASINWGETQRTHLVVDVLPGREI